LIVTSVELHFWRKKHQFCWLCRSKL